MTTGKTKKIIFIMGVSGSGKTSVGQLLAEELSVPFIEGDDHHPISNIEKMSQGIPLNDNDREPWLAQLHKLAKDNTTSGCVIACSALKEVYRKQLSQGIEPQVLWVYLQGTYDQIFERMENRKDHFMDAAMLKSQFETLEKPKKGIVINVSDPVEGIVRKVKSNLEMKTEIGVVGMGVMGKSLSRNLARKGFKVSLFNRHVDGKEENIAADFKSSYAELKQALPFDDLKAFVQSLETPRKIIMMVNAGPAVGAVLDQLSNILEEGDLVIDGGNSHFEDTNRRIEWMKTRGFIFIGAGISGGEEGALTGPSIMPSGEKEGYSKVQKYLEAIAAKDGDGNPCCTYVGKQGSGHFVKMVHNGIEYVEMQLLAECYSILKSQGRSNEEIATAFESWMGDLGSYLLEITVAILRKKEGKEYVLDKILDKAGNKGTGKWTTLSIADLGEPATMIPAALFTRYLSFFKDQREETADIFPTKRAGDEILVDQLKEAYQFSRIVNHHQGFLLIARVSEQHRWEVNLSEIARIWTEGCIIKSDFMKELVECLKTDSNLLLNDKLIETIKKTHPSIQSVTMTCVKRELHIPCLLAATNFFHGIKAAHSSANLIQAQRDYFGAHTYQRIDDPSGESYHTEW